MGIRCFLLLLHVGSHLEYPMSWRGYLSLRRHLKRGLHEGLHHPHGQHGAKPRRRGFEVLQAQMPISSNGAAPPSPFNPSLCPTTLVVKNFCFRSHLHVLAGGFKLFPMSHPCSPIFQVSWSPWELLKGLLGAFSKGLEQRLVVEGGPVATT